MGERTNDSHRVKGVPGFTDENRYKGSSEERRRLAYGRINARRHWQKLPKPWSTLYFNVWRKLRDIFKTEPEWTQEFQLYLGELCWSYVMWRKAQNDSDNGEMLKNPNGLRWTAMLERSVKVQERKRFNRRSKAIAVAVFGTIEELIGDQVLKDNLKAKITQRLEEALKVDE